MLPHWFSGIRARILLIALVPSLVLLAISIVAAGVLIDRGRHAQDFAETVHGHTGPTLEIVLSVEQERLFAVAQLTGSHPDPVAVRAARDRFDSALRAIVTVEADFRETGDGQINEAVGALDQLRIQLPKLRESVDTGAAPLADVFYFYSRLLDGMNTGSAVVERNAPDVTSALELSRTLALLGVLESVSRSTALTLAASSPEGLPAALQTEYRNLVGAYHAELAQLARELGPESARMAAELIDGADFKQVAAMEDALLRPESVKVPAGQRNPADMVMDWRAAAERVTDQLVELWKVDNEASWRHAADSGAEIARESLYGSGVAVAVAVLAFACSLLLANRLIIRLRRLRKEMLVAAQQRLPETIRRLSTGADVDPESEAAELDFGRDEIGEVASAFNAAYGAAVGAAVAEARTREGVRAVFLNIAHRSQLVVNRQLELLDEAEQRQEDPALLEMFFRLDHLATRERRNAENLIILGGGRPERRWRKPVPLLELVRSAASETIDYARVQTGRQPEVFVLGDSVADLIHLLAELVDNATTFSPPGSRVDIVGSVVGRGVAVDIVDCGVGMTREQTTQVNRMLSEPPDFGVAALSSDSRLGMFVVAKLAERQGVTVRLSESDYGGIRAVVLIPSVLLAEEPTSIDVMPPRAPGRHIEPAAVREQTATWDGAIAPPAGAVPTAATPVVRGGMSWTESHVGIPLPPSEDERPPLPRRTRQASLAPELAGPASKGSGQPVTARSAEEARDRMSALESGTRQGRQADVVEPADSGRHHSIDESKGYREFFQP
ncbi:nitrate- and nitrite sensing domain-containing protein [Nocardia sp. XZ_19_231]|uniref:nitrate- and nitrite sensing domain-containing protein n=1 Tax=Nocardia sp. XZ_19_231 TaxID=2769252 RepID=UPI00351C782E